MNNRLTIFITIIFLFAAEQALAASQTLMINPVRVVLQGRQRSTTVSVANVSSSPVKYKVSLITMRKNAQGGLYEVTKDNKREELTKKMIRFSPRRSIIQPGTRQVVKLMVRKPRGLPPGEYRTRLRFMPITDPKSNSSKGQMDSEKPQIKIDLIVGVSIPVIVQHGEVNSEILPVSLSLTKYPQTPSGLVAQVTLSRTGDYSVFGDIILKYIPTSGGDDVVIAEGKSIGVYNNDTQKTFVLPVKNWAEGAHFGKIRVEVDQKMPGNRSGKITAKEFPINGGNAVIM